MISAILEFVVMLLVSAVADVVAWVFRRSTGFVRTRTSYADRLGEIRIIRRNRAIRRFLKQAGETDAIPAVGLTCPNCDYSITGLVARICPECGDAFDLESMIDTSVER